jgi:hypothetical protein
VTVDIEIILSFLVHTRSILQKEFLPYKNMPAEELLDISPSEFTSTCLRDHANSSQGLFSGDSAPELHKKELVLPVHCGHNGILSQCQLSVFDLFAKSSYSNNEVEN